jgi:hypothetical protein
MTDYWWVGSITALNFNKCEKAHCTLKTNPWNAVSEIGQTANNFVRRLSSLP